MSALNRIVAMNDKKRTILLVEDEVIIAMAQSQAVRGFGYEVVIANSGEEAVELTGQNKAVSLILMDIDLGSGIDGPQAAQQILAKRHIPIVFLTSHAERVMVEKVRGITRYGYVIKNSGDFVLQSSIEMAFELFEAHKNLLIQHDLSIALNSTMDLREGLENVLNVVLQFESIDCGGVYVADPVSGSLDLAVHNGLSPEFIAHVSHYDPDSPNVRMAMAGKAGYGSYPDIRPSIDDTLMKEGLRAVAFIPVLSQGQLIAVINLASHSMDSIPAGTRIILETLASNIGSALMRLRTDAAMKESEEKFRRITENMSDIVIEIDAEGIIKYVSPSYRRIFGENPGELIGRSIFKGVHPEDRERAIAACNDAARMRTDREVDYRYRHADGSYIWLRTSGHPLYDAAGKSAGAIFTSSDISERKRTEDALRAANDLFLQFVKHSPIHTFIKEVTPTRSLFLQASNNFKEMSGISVDKMIGKTMAELYPAEFAEKITEDDWAVVSSGDVMTFDEDYNGRSYTSIKFPIIQGDKTLLAGFTIDITERKRAEHRARERTKELQAFYSISAITEREDISLDELYKEIIDILPESWQYPEIACARIVIGGLEFRTKNFSESPWMQSAPIRVNGSEAGIIEVRYILEKPLEHEGPFLKEERLLLDAIAERIGHITERKKAGQALRESESRYRAFFENSIDAILLTTPDGRVEAANPEACRIFDMTEEEIIRSGREGIIDASDPRLKPALEERAKTGRFRGGLTFKRKDGTAFQAEISSGIFTDMNGFIKTAMIIRDVTDRNRAEGQLQDLLAEKDLILKEVHHRIKNNMGTMMSLLSLQSNKLRDPAAVAVIEDARNRMQSMELLYDKLYRSEKLLEMPAREYLAPLVDEILSIFPDSATVKIEKQIDDFILSVKALSPLGIIVNELITNSMKYAFNGRDDRVITVAASVKGNRASLVIGDNGAGIPESVDMENSTGFGLTLVSLLVKQLGGSIKIERGRGTRFVLEFEV